MEDCKSSEEEPLLNRILTNLIGGVIIVVGAVAIFWAIYIKNHWSDQGTRAGYFGIAVAATVCFVFFGGLIILDLCAWAIEAVRNRLSRIDRSH